jgi:hypothetical protein
MERDIDASAYGIAAFSILEALVPKIVEHNLLSKSELLAILDRVAHVESSRGFASDSDVDSDASRLSVKLANIVRHGSR